MRHRAARTHAPDRRDDRAEANGLGAREGGTARKERVEETRTGRYEGNSPVEATGGRKHIHVFLRGRFICWQIDTNYVVNV